MMTMQLSEAARVLAGSFTGSDNKFTGVSTDTRQLQPGALFFALQGPNFDGHGFIETARAQGAIAAAVAHPCESALPQIEVADTRLALGSLSAHWRQQFTLPVIGITGSNGKTTVRAMTAAILSQCGDTLATQGNLNNDIGLPLTLARLAADHRFAVLEMGANHPGEIDYLAGLAQPTIAIVTNAGPAHLEGFGDLQGVARAKGELFARLGKDGVAVINADDTFAPLWRELAAHCRIVEFGLQGADVTADWQGDASGSDVQLHTAAGNIELRLALPGRHNVMNALAASAAALAAGAGLDAVKAGLETLSQVAGRFNVHSLPGDITLIDDTYNANPESLQVALDVLALAPGDSWLVLGDMGELGADAAALHSAAGRNAREAGVSRLYGLGELAQLAVKAFDGPGGAYASMDELLAVLQRQLSGPLHILVKGSRRMRMERVVAALGVQPKAGEMH
ncbi:MAG: UDP-N-acetylmuramoyl-tripeptide--D-alanyl-D-alanine ligase [Gammaproteobacteria bacterium]|nr:UDP-N-acetylmuramoyl-tripeptide--D-alanyl-D-alanine ligase [Gammaproteobacteria bacterium]